MFHTLTNFVRAFKDGRKFENERRRSAKLLRVGRWEAYKECTHCEHEMFHEDIYNADGVCPYCGYRDSIGVVSNYKTLVRRWVAIDEHNNTVNQWEYK